MSLLFETIHGDITIDLNHNDTTLQNQLINVIGLTELTYLAKLHTFLSPSLHFNYRPNHFLFFGDSTYSGKGGQSVFSLLNAFDPTNHLASRFSTFKPLVTPDTKGSFSSHVQYDIRRRDWTKGFLDQARETIRGYNQQLQLPTTNNNQPPPPLDPSNFPILLISIPHNNGDVSSLFGLYFTAPPQTTITTTTTMSDSDSIPPPSQHIILDPYESFPEVLYDYVIGVVDTGHRAAQSLLINSLPDPLLPHHTNNTNPWLSSKPHTDNNNNNNNNERTNYQLTKNGDLLTQVGVVFSPFNAITSPEKRPNCLIPHHNRKLVKSLRDAKLTQFSKTVQEVADKQKKADGMGDGENPVRHDQSGLVEQDLIDFGDFGSVNDANQDQTQLLFLDTFAYNPIPQHYPSFLRQSEDQNWNEPVQSPGGCGMGQLDPNSPPQLTSADLLARKHSHLTTSGFHVKTLARCHNNNNNNNHNGNNSDDDDDESGEGGESDDRLVKIQVAFEEPKNVLFISNLNYNTTQESLSSYLSSHCAVLGCNILKERVGSGGGGSNDRNNQQRQLWKCYAFVAVATEKQCDLAVRTLNKSLLDGSSINVGYCHSNSGTNSMYLNVHMGTNTLRRRPQKATLASTIIAGGGAAGIGNVERGM